MAYPEKKWQRYWVRYINLLLCTHRRSAWFLPNSAAFLLIWKWGWIGEGVVRVKAVRTQRWAKSPTRPLISTSNSIHWAEDLINTNSKEWKNRSLFHVLCQTHIVLSSVRKTERGAHPCWKDQKKPPKPKTTKNHRQFHCPGPRMNFDLFKIAGWVQSQSPCPTTFRLHHHFPKEYFSENLIL